MTTLVSQIRKFDPFFVGFDQLFNNLVNFDFDRSPTTYPPYNIVQDGDYTYAIELAVAGFGEDDISIEHRPENGVLTIVGKAQSNGTQNAMIYKDCHVQMVKIKNICLLTVTMLCKYRIYIIYGKHLKEIELYHFH